MANEALVKSIDEATDAIEQALAKCNSTALAGLPALKQAVTLAGGMQALRRAMTDEIVQRVFMPLQGNALGFITDKDRDGGYPVDVVRDCMIEGMIKGLRPIGNEINIIAGRCYAAKNGLERIVRTWPGLTDLRITPGVPQMAGDKGALVAMHASWLLNGKPMYLVRDQSKDADGVVHDTRFAIRVNGGMGPDAIIGKATRKLYKAILDVVSAGTLTVDDGEAIEATGVVVNSAPTPAPAEPAQDGKRIRIGGNTKGAHPERKSEPESKPAQEPGVDADGNPT